MNVQNRIIKAINKEEKTELSSQKIELAAPQFNKYGSKAQSIYNDARNKAQKDLVNVKDALNKGDKDLISLENELFSEIDRVTQQAKVIGVDIKETSVYQNMKKAVQEFEQYEKAFKKSISQVKGLKL